MRAKLIMNFDIDYRHTHIVRSPQAVPLLTLIREWARYKEEAYARADVVFLILRGIQPLANFVHGLEIDEILASLEDDELKQNFKDSFCSVLDDLLEFVNLFDDLQSLLHQPDSPGMLDVNYSNSVIGMYIRQCVLECKKLTFSQLIRFHLGLQKYFVQRDDGSFTENSQKPSVSNKKKRIKELDFVGKMKKLVLFGREEGEDNISKPSSPAATAIAAGAVADTSKMTMLGKMELGNEAVKLMELHGQFGHNQGIEFALEEVNSLAQRSDNFSEQYSNDALLIEHAMAWLIELKMSFDIKNTLEMLAKFVKNAENLNIPLLALWGKLQQVKIMISSADPPKEVLQTLMSSVVSYLCCYDEDGSWKSAMHLSCLSMLATMWEYYGHRLLSLHYSQLICHVMSCDHLPESLEEQECLALAIATISEHLYQTGEIEVSLQLLKSSIALFSNTGQPFKILCQCEARLKFETALNAGDFVAAKTHLVTIGNLDPAEGAFRSAVFTSREGRLLAEASIENIQHSMKSANKVSPELYSKYLQLLSDVYSDLGMANKALSLLTECLVLCKRHHLPQHKPLLKQASVWLQLKAPAKCLNTLESTCQQLLEYGSLEDRGLMYLLKAQAMLFQSGSSFRERIPQVLPLVRQASEDFSCRCSDTQLSKKSSTLLGWLNCTVQSS